MKTVPSSESSANCPSRLGCGCRRGEPALLHTPPFQPKEVSILVEGHFLLTRFRHLLCTVHSLCTPLPSPPTPPLGFYEF